MSREHYQRNSLLDKERLRDAYQNGDDFPGVARIHRAYSIAPRDHKSVARGGSNQKNSTIK